MILNYFSLAHIIYIVIALVFVLGLYFLLRSKSEKTQRAVILALMLLNVIQHLFKLNIYPQYDGGFNALCTAYNMCAFLILLSPAAYLVKSNIIRDFVFYIGSVAGIIAIVIPYWNIGEPAFSWNVYRFFICHALLFASSLLPLLFGHHKTSWKNFYKIGFCFFGAITLIIINDIIFICLGMYDGLTVNDLYGSLAAANPCWSFGPPGEFAFVNDIAKALSPDIFVGENATGLCIPILWYFIPVYIGITLLAFLAYAFADRKNFISDMRAYKEKIIDAKKRISNKK